MGGNRLGYLTSNDSGDSGVNSGRRGIIQPIGGFGVGTLRYHPTHWGSRDSDSERIETMEGIELVTSIGISNPSMPETLGTY
jgi:hypothetical protein